MVCICMSFTASSCILVSFNIKDVIKNKIITFKLIEQKIGSNLLNRHREQTCNAILKAYHEHLNSLVSYSLVRELLSLVFSESRILFCNKQVKFISQHFDFYGGSLFGKIIQFDCRVVRQLLCNAENMQSCTIVLVVVLLSTLEYQGKLKFQLKVM